MNLETYQKEYEKQQKEIKRTEEFIQKNLVRASTTKQAQSRRKMLEKMVILEKPEKEKKVHFEFEFTKSFNMSALETKYLNIGYNYPILKNINLKFEFGKKYLIYGKNGVGKSTFLKTILGIIPPLGGNIKLVPYNDILYYAQEEKVPEITAIQYVRNFYPKMDDTEIRTLLAKYAVTGDLTIKPMTQLSGGEVTKVRFALLSLTRSNMLILDEPTNHLDKSAKESLLKAIEKYPGTVILVSHEKEFYQKLKMKEIKFE
jgi:ATPase subunit of ABC transporter with duplicated ATPase domains